MDKLVIDGGTPLAGEVAISGAKNAALPIQCAALLSAEPLVLSRVPRLNDTRTMAKLLTFGTPEQVRARLEALAAQAGADEVMVMTLCHAAEPRLRSYELLARAFDLD